MATEQEHLLEQLSRDKLFSIYQFLLLESRTLEELSRSSSKGEMVSALARVLSLEDAQYCVEFFENYEFYDVPSMKWAMLDALPDELLATLHTIYLDDIVVVEDHRELVDRLGQSPYFLKEDARKFYLWYNYFRKRMSLEQLAQTSGHFGIPVNLNMQTQRVDLQANRNMPLFSMATHGDILGLSPTPPSNSASTLPGSERIAQAAHVAQAAQEVVSVSPNLAVESVFASNMPEVLSTVELSTGFSSLSDSSTEYQSVSNLAETPVLAKESSSEMVGWVETPFPSPSPSPLPPLDGGNTREVHAPARVHTSAEHVDTKKPWESEPSSLAKDTQEKLDGVSNQAQSLPRVPRREKEAASNQTIEITALDLDNYIKEQEGKKNSGSPRQEESTRVDHAFARVVEEIKKRQTHSPSPPEESPVPKVPPAVAARRGFESHPTIIINTMELNAALEQIESLEAGNLKAQEKKAPDPVTPQSLLVEEHEGELVELEPLEESLDEPLDDDDAAHLLDESALIEDGGMEDEGVDGFPKTVFPPFPGSSDMDTADSLHSAHTTTDETADEPPKQTNGKNKEAVPPEMTSASSLPNFSVPTWGAMMMTRGQLDLLTFLLYRICLVGAPYGRIQIRAIRLYMQRILGCDPAQLRWIRDKLKELQTQELPLVPPPLAGLAALMPLLSYGMRLHFLHTAIFLLGVKSLSTLERQHEFLHELAVELGIAPEDVSFFDLFNIGREEIQLGMQDCLELFGLESGAKEEAIRKAHRDLAKRFHPDKFHSLGPEFLRLAERKMKEANMALEILLYRADRNV